MKTNTNTELRQLLDDSVLTHTGRSIGDLASEKVASDIDQYVHQKTIETKLQTLKEIADRQATYVADVRTSNVGNLKEAEATLVWLRQEQGYCADDLAELQASLNTEGGAYKQCPFCGAKSHGTKDDVPHQKGCKDYGFQ